MRTRSPRPRRLIFSCRVGDLLLRQCDGICLHAVVLGGVAGQRAPAAADVEQRLAGLQPQLAADHFQLVLLHLVDVIIPIGAVGAGVDHLLIEPERVEFVRHVVVVADVLLVLCRAAVARALARYVGERPRAAARHEQESRQGSKSAALCRGSYGIRACAPWAARARGRTMSRCGCRSGLRPRDCRGFPNSGGAATRRRRPRRRC